ncbi:MAG: hypothetical protein ABI954_07855 [Pyrinomonadaceae bacterium]
MITIRYMIYDLTSGDKPEPEINGIQYAMYLQTPGDWFPNSAGSDLNLDGKERCKYVLNKAKTSQAITILVPWTTLRTEAEFLIKAFKSKKPVKDFIRIECYYTDRNDISFGSAASGNFEFTEFAGLNIDGFRVTQYRTVGGKIGRMKHATAEIFTLDSDKMTTF